MTRGRRHIAVLAQIGRMAEMRRRQTLQDLADALSEEGRAGDLEARSGALAAGYLRTEAATGAVLADQARVTAQLERLQRQAAGFREAASLRSETARHLLSRTSEQVDDLDQRLVQARRQFTQRQDRKEQSVQHNLARNLLNSSRKASAKAKGGTR